MVSRPLVIMRDELGAIFDILDRAIGGVSAATPPLQLQLFGQMSGYVLKREAQLAASRGRDANAKAQRA